MARKPKNYNGTETTTRQIGDVLSTYMRQLRTAQGERPDLVIAAWPEVVGSRIASMTQAVSFVEGTLEVNVKNSTLLSLLNGTEKMNVLRSLRTKFPSLEIKNIRFRMG